MVRCFGVWVGEGFPPVVDSLKISTQVWPCGNSGGMSYKDSDDVGYLPAHINILIEDERDFLQVTRLSGELVALANRS